jgi:hypothetical protein
VTHTNVRDTERDNEHLSLLDNTHPIAQTARVKSPHHIVQLWHFHARATIITMNAPLAGSTDPSSPPHLPRTERSHRC